MALFRPKLQISSQKAKTLGNTKEIFQNSFGIDKKLFWSWFRKQDVVKQIECPLPGNVCKTSTCKARLPECPQYIDTGIPSACLEKYAKPRKSKKKPWFSFSKSQKQKPSHSCPPSCKKELTFKEYIFGVPKPLPDPMTCRARIQHQHYCNLRDPRLEDPRYEVTLGDVLLYTYPEKYEQKPNPGPQPKNPAPYRVPSAVICKKVSDLVAKPDCYCACFHKEKELYDSNLCPVHARTYKFPYQEMRPMKDKKKYFTCKEGVVADEVVLPQRTDCCAPVYLSIAKQDHCPPPPRLGGLLQPEPAECMSCQDSCQQLTELDGDPKRKMSRIERLKVVTAEKQSDMNFQMYVKKPATCGSRCNGTTLVPPQS